MTAGIAYSGAAKNIGNLNLIAAGLSIAFLLRRQPYRIEMSPCYSTSTRRRILKAAGEGTKRQKRDSGVKTSNLCQNCSAFSELGNQLLAIVAQLVCPEDFPLKPAFDLTFWLFSTQLGTYFRKFGL